MTRISIVSVLAAVWLAGCCCPSGDDFEVPEVEAPKSKKDKKKKKKGDDKEGSKSSDRETKKKKDKKAPTEDVVSTKNVSMDSGRFTVTMGKAARKQSNTFDTAIGPVTQETWLFERKSDFVFSAIHGHFQKKVKRRQFNIKAALDGGVDGAIGSLNGGKKLYSKKVSLGGYEGREFQSPVNLIGKEYRMTSRIYIAYRPKKKGAKISIEQYQLAVIHPVKPSKAQQKEIDNFFASAAIKE